MSRPAYALSETDSFIVENDYELLNEEDYSVGTIESCFQVWIKPSDCWPVDTGTPPCTGAFGVEYNADSDSDVYDDAFYDSIRTYWIALDPFCTDITDEVPGAGLALVYSIIPQCYAAIAYFGEKTGVFVVLAEADMGTLVPDNRLHLLSYVYNKDTITTIMVNIGDKVSDVLKLPGFNALLTIGSLVTIVAITYLIKKKKR